jgi:integrase
MRLRECVPLYLRHAVDLSPSTVKKIGYEVTRWERLTLDPPVELAQTETFADFRSACLQRGLASRSIESNIDTVRMLMRIAVESGRFTVVPPVGRRLKKPRPKPSPLTIDDLRSLFVAADAASWPNHVRSPQNWWRAFFVLGYWTGLRLSDLCWGISWDHFAIRQKLIAFPAGKTGHFHEYPIPDRLLIHLARNSSHGAVLGPPKSYKCFRRELATIAASAGLARKVTAKTLRQTCVNEWSKVSRDAGRIVHGCGLGDVRDHYVDSFSILAEAAARMPWPFPDDVQGRQLRLF